MPNLEILTNPYTEHARAIIDLLDSYALDPIGGGEALPSLTHQTLVNQLQSRDWVVTFLALLDGQPAGLLIAMEGFSTFQARPLMNIHDVAVVPEQRGRGIGKALFAAVEAEAIRRGCCKLTLEVLSGNERAKRVYTSLGFKPYALDPEAGTAQFWEKKL
jgi:ribosomal protein S18 acetylase RimI-like enzyme